MPVSKNPTGSQKALRVTEGPLVAFKEPLPAFDGFALVALRASHPHLGAPHQGRVYEGPIPPPAPSSGGTPSIKGGALMTFGLILSMQRPWGARCPAPGCPPRSAAYAGEGTRDYIDIQRPRKRECPGHK